MEEETTMKSKWTVFLSSITLLLLIITLVPFQVQAQGPNLLKNPGFEEGHYNQDGIVEITVPNGWRMHWSNGESNIFDGYAETARPETVVWNIAGAPDREKSVFWKDGIYTVKIFKGWAPLWAAMSQDVSGLEVGRRYRLVAPVFIDIVADYGEGGKIPPADGRQGRVRLGASPLGAAWRDESSIGYSGWWTGENVYPFYQAYPTFIHEFTATAPDMTVWIEMASNYPHINNGFFIDTVGLYALDEVDTAVVVASALDQGTQATGQGAPAPAVPAAPAPAPLPTATPRADGAVVHIVQPGDSFWALAIKYAATMGLTPEEALQAIPERNNNPSVISNGMELIIVPPSEDGGQAVADAPDATEESSESEPEVEETPEPVEGSENPAAADAVDSRSAIAEVLPQVSPGSICVQVFEDANNDGQRAEQGELPMPDQAVTISQDGNTVTTYVTDGSGELHCFEELEAGTYQVQIFPTADYVVTGDDSWAVAIAQGVMIPVSFGLQVVPEAVANAGEQAVDSAEDAAAAEQITGSGLLGNIGIIVLGVAAVLIVLAGAGVYLLRRG
jgi:hypothetical protein